MADNVIVKDTKKWGLPFTIGLIVGALVLGAPIVMAWTWIKARVFKPKVA